MNNGTVEKIFAIIFIISMPVTAFFWLFFSDTRGVDEETEKGFAEIVNKNYSEGDVVFPEVDWDLNFLKFLDHGITNVLLTLKESEDEDIRMFRENGSKIFFLLKNPRNWEKIKTRLNIDQYEKSDAGKGAVVIVPPLESSINKKLIFSRDIHEAQRVFFSQKETEKPCVLNNRKQWECSRHDWNFVGARRVVVNKRPAQAVWAHPRSNEDLNIVFDIPENSSYIHLTTAMLERAVRSRNRSPVRVRVLIDGEPVLRYTNRSVRAGHYNKIEVPEDSKELKIIFNTSDDGQRHFIFKGFIE